MSSDYNKPAGTSTKASFPQEIRDNVSDSVIMFDGDPTTANLPVNAKRIDNSDKQVYNWNGSSWDSIGYLSPTADPVGDIVDGAPVTLDTLNEIAAAIADDANFASTVLLKASNLSDVSNTATARTNLDVYSKSEVNSAISSSAGLRTIYLANSATGDGSGSDASNRMEDSNLAFELRDGQDFLLYMDGGTYNMHENLYPYEYSSLVNKRIKFLIESNVTINDIDAVNCDFSFGGENGESNTVTFSDSGFHNCRLDFTGELDINGVSGPYHNGGRAESVDVIFAAGRELHMYGSTWIGGDLNMSLDSIGNSIHLYDGSTMNIDGFYGYGFELYRGCNIFIDGDCHCEGIVEVQNGSKAKITGSVNTSTSASDPWNIQYDSSIHMTTGSVTPITLDVLDGSYAKLDGSWTMADIFIRRGSGIYCNGTFTVNATSALTIASWAQAGTWAGTGGTGLSADATSHKI